MSTRERVPAVVMAITLCVVLVATAHLAMAQTRQPYAVASRSALTTTSKGLAAIDAAADSDKYLFIFFWKSNDANTKSMYPVFQSAMGQWNESADSISINIATATEKPVVDKFGVSRAPMPLVLALAPNGAITKGFPTKFDQKQLQEGFVSPCTAQCLKCLQAQKLVLLCIQNEKTQFTQVAMAAAQSFKADARYAKATEIVAVNPEDQAEAVFLQDLKVDPRTSQAVTVLLAPSGQPVARFVGAVTKDQIVAKAQAGPCAGGTCGPRGCCPK